MILSIYTYQLSIKLLRAVLKKSEMSFKNITTNYFVLFIIMIVSDVIISVYSAYAVPRLIKMILPMIVQI